MLLKIKLGLNTSEVPHLTVQHLSALLTITHVTF
jgi:hypothetical protein